LLELILFVTGVVALGLIVPTTTSFIGFKPKKLSFVSTACSPSAACSCDWNKGLCRENEEEMPQR